MKRMVSLLLALVLALCIGAVPVSAEEAPYVFEMMYSFAGTVDENAQRYLKHISEALNVEIELVLPATTAYEESLQLMIASGEYVDLALIPNQNAPVFLDAVRAGIFLPLNSLLEEYGQDILEYSYDISWETLKVLKDENIYGVPRTSIARADGFAFRKDWCDTLGIAFNDGDYLTVDQLYDMLYAFTYNDPDQNGVQDTYGMRVFGNMAAQYQWTFGLNGWQEYDGVYMDKAYDPEADNMIQALEFTSKLWQDGLIDPDWPTLDQSMAEERFSAGITGLSAFFPGNMTRVIEVGRQVNPNYELYYTPGIKLTEDSTFSGGSFTTGLWGAWAISASAEQPEKIMSVLNWMIGEGWDETQYGAQGYAWDYVDGKPVPTENFEFGWFGRNLVRRNNDAGFFVSLGLDQEEREHTAYLIQLSIDQLKFPLDGGYRPGITEDPTFIDYQKYMNTEIAKIITGEKAPEYYYELLDGWYKAGGDQYVAEMQAFIAASNQ